MLQDHVISTITDGPSVADAKGHYAIIKYIPHKALGIPDANTQ